VGDLIHHCSVADSKISLQGKLYRAFRASVHVDGSESFEIFSARSLSVSHARANSLLLSLSQSLSIFLSSSLSFSIHSLSHFLCPSCFLVPSLFECVTRDHFLPSFDRASMLRVRNLSPFWQRTKESRFQDYAQQRGRYSLLRARATPKNSNTVGNEIQQKYLGSSLRKCTPVGIHDTGVARVAK
jgi:hypothetical protein